MIRVHALTIEDFRGIRKLQLDFGGRNFAVCGPNGTGKSGVVDAIEFAITGSITRLTGQGTQAITLRAHAPHVDRRNEPGKARVILKAHIPSLDKFVTIERHVDNPNTPVIVPADPDVLGIVSELAQHPEFALSRREIIKYVIAAPGERSKEVQALLRLDQLERVRSSLQSIVNACKARGKRIDEEISQSQAQLSRGLGLAVLKREDVLREVNKRRLTLQLSPLVELEATTSLKAGFIAAPEAAAKPKVPKNQGILDIRALSECLDQGETAEMAASKAAMEPILEQLMRSASLLRNLRHEQFLTAGADLIDDNLCPFCDTEWDINSLRSHVQQKLDEARQATTLKNSLEKAAKPIVSAVSTAESLASTLSKYGQQLSPPVDVSAVQAWTESLRAKRDRLLKLTEIQEMASDLSAGYLRRPEEVNKAVENVRSGIETLPDPNKEEAAKEYLTVCQERLDVYREARRAQERCKKETELAARVFDLYNKSSTSVLTQIYKDVEQDFSKYYRIVNREDEATFHGKLIPSIGKLGFDVEFYGRGYFPPGAYHSEGHQDAMGICLYLALMKHTLATQFTFAVLDDVLMSVDANHRREVCGLLKSEFPATQFIITTHDPIWLQHMKTEQLITAKSSVQFRKWSVDDGPVAWDTGEIWKDINEDLDRNDVAGGAGTLRRYLEYISAHLSDKLRASVEYHGDAQYELGDLLPGLIHAWKRLLAKAQEAAQSWGRGREEADRIGKLQDEFSRRVAKSQVEQWAINKSIHYNEWMNLTKQEFLPVLDSFKALLDSLRCGACGGFFYVTPAKGAPENIRCDCGSVNLNLKKKP